MRRPDAIQQLDGGYQRAERRARSGALGGKSDGEVAESVGRARMDQRLKDKPELMVCEDPVPNRIGNEPLNPADLVIDAYSQLGFPILGAK